MEEIFKKDYPNLYDMYIMYSIGKSKKDSNIRDFIITSDLFEDVDWSIQTPNMLYDKLNEIEMSLTV